MTARRRSGVRCPAGCGSRASRVVDVNAEDNGSTFRVRECLRCGCVFGTTETSTGMTRKKYVRPAGKKTTGCEVVISDEVR